MTAKEFLRQYTEANNDINDRLEEISRLRAQSVSIKVNLNPNKVQSSGDNDPLSSIIGKIVDMERDVNEEIDRLIKIKKQVLTSIMSLSNHKQRRVLYHRYILDEKWEQIAEKTESTYQWVCVLHSRALQEIILILDNN